MSGIELIFPLIIALVVLFFFINVFSLSVSLLWNGLIGAVALWVINLVGGFFSFSLEITFFKALIAGFFGVPGVVAVLLWELLK